MPNPIYHFIPEEETFENRLIARIGTCRTAFLSSAFFTYGAAMSLKPAIAESLSKGAALIFLLGRFDYVTEPKAVDFLLGLSKKNPKQLRVYFDADFTFHFKLAVFKEAVKTAVIVGSSNLTPKGLSAVGEVNLEIIGNTSVYKNALHILQDRIKTAVPAENAIEDYRKKYNKAKKYRQLRQRWHKTGQKAWKPHLKKRTYVVPEGSSFRFVLVSELENDKTLKQNIEKEHSHATNKGHNFPNQWVHFGDKIQAHYFKEDDIFVMCSVLERNVGFALCTKKIKVLSENDRLENVIFFRFLRGHKLHLRDKARFQKAVKTIGLSDRNTIGKVSVEKLKAMLNKQQSKSA